VTTHYWSQAVACVLIWCPAAAVAAAYFGMTGKSLTSDLDGILTPEENVLLGMIISAACDVPGFLARRLHDNLVRLIVVARQPFIVDVNVATLPHSRPFALRGRNTGCAGQQHGAEDQRVHTHSPHAAEARSGPDSGAIQGTVRP